VEKKEIDAWPVKSPCSTNNLPVAVCAYSSKSPLKWPTDECQCVTAGVTALRLVAASNT
jgi:hypothetical protein